MDNKHEVYFRDYHEDGETPALVVFSDDYRNIPMWGDYRGIQLCRVEYNRSNLNSLNYAAMVAQAVISQQIEAGAVFNSRKNMGNPKEDEQDRYGIRRAIRFQVFEYYRGEMGYTIEESGDQDLTQLYKHTCNEDQCPECGYNGLLYQPWHRRYSYWHYAVCPQCGHRHDMDEVDF